MSGWLRPMAGPRVGSEIVVTLDGNAVVCLTGNLLPSAALDALGFDPTPALSSDEAVELAKADQNLQQPTADLAATTELMATTSVYSSKRRLIPIWFGKW